MEFKTALRLAQNLKDPTEEKKAARGLGASLQRQVKYREGIKYHSMVLEISGREREDSGNTEASGAIADCYTELGNLERAANYHEQYIARLQTDRSILKKYGWDVLLSALDGLTSTIFLEIIFVVFTKLLYKKTGSEVCTE